MTLFQLQMQRRRLELRSQTLFKVINRFGLGTTKQQSSSHRGQSISYITQKDFDFIVENYSTNKTTSNEAESSSSSSVQFEQGVFYLIQLEPDHDPGRFKLGFTSNMPERLRAHRCSAPFATVLDSWPCHVLWEKTAIDSVTQGCEKLHTEVFRAEDITKVKANCDQFFGLMPKLEDILR